MTGSESKGRVYYVALGCDKNLVDAEKMLGRLVDAGYTITDDEEAADIAVVNTCCFIQDAQEESIDTLLELGELRRSGQLRALIATGCLAQRFTEPIKTEIPEVDGIVGTTAADRIIEVLEAVLTRNAKSQEKAPRSHAHAAEGDEDLAKDPAVVCLAPLDKSPTDPQRRVLTGYGSSAFLKIAEGCRKHCSYCVIPSIRGDFRSVPMEELIKEATELAERGIKELTLVAQETTLYGVDLYGEKKLPELLIRLCRIEGLAWIRLMYCYPEEITDDLIDVMAREPKILHYLDMPIQHAADSCLHRMKRMTNRAELTERIAAIRRAIPDVCLRTSLIAGFPGETEEEFKELLTFVREIRFDRLGVFAYSREEGTEAAAMKGQVSARDKKRRRAALMEAQQPIAFAKARAMKGRVLPVIIEGRLEDDAVYAARSYMDAPGVDGLVFVESGREYMSGDIITVKVTGARDYDLVAKPVDGKGTTYESAE